MSYTPLLEYLGFEPDERVVVFTADDFGMCEATISALDDLADAGIVSSASVMAPCPWFPAAAEWARQHPEFSVGVHLTLTSEWSNYRWSSVTEQTENSGLLDGTGYLHRERQDVVAHANPVAVSEEMQAQVRRALDAGIDVTHIDSHMYTAVRLPFLPDYLNLQQQFDVPVVLWPFQDRPDIGMPSEELAQASELVATGVNSGDLFVLAKQLWTRMAPPAADVETVKQMLSELPQGLTRFYIHPAKDTRELRRIVPDWQCRVADHQVFLSSELRRFIQRSEIHMVSYRQLRNAMRAMAAETCHPER